MGNPDPLHQDIRYNIPMNLWPLISSFLIIAAAELGDKTQLLTLGFATHFRLGQTMSAVAAATAVLMALAVLFGGAINRYVPEFYLQLAAGIIFIGFGLWTLMNGREKNEEKELARIHNPFLLIFATFFLAELGDKTQLAALALAARYGTPVQVWLGATAGMVLINLVAALAGSFIKSKVSDKTIRIFGAAVFILFGIFTLWGILK